MNNRLTLVASLCLLFVSLALLPHVTEAAQLNERHDNSYGFSAIGTKGQLVYFSSGESLRNLSPTAWKGSVGSNSPKVVASNSPDGAAGFLWTNSQIVYTWATPDFKQTLDVGVLNQILATAAIPTPEVRIETHNTTP